MDEVISRINSGFLLKSSDLIYSALLDFFDLNETTVSFRHHPLGFQFVNLGKISDSEELRLHIWRNDNHQEYELHIHNHSFDFESFVVTGKIKNFKFKMVETSSIQGQLYRVLFLNNKSFLEEIKHKQHTEFLEAQVIKAGEFYSMHKAEFHYTENVVPFAITLIKIKKPTIFNAPLVFLKEKVKNFKSFKRSTLTKSDSKSIIELIKKSCSNNMV